MTNITVKSVKGNKEQINSFPDVEEAMAFCYHMVEHNICAPQTMWRGEEQLYDRHNLMSEIIAQRKTLAIRYLDYLKKQRENEPPMEDMNGGKYES